MTVSYCPRCSKPQVPGDQVCPRCGQRLDETIPTGGPTSPTAWVGQASPAGWGTPKPASGGRLTAVIIAIVVIFVVVMILLPVVLALLVLPGILDSIPDVPFPSDFPFPSDRFVGP